ncbi:MAG: cytochrome c, partial [Acidobacteria bacterium]|nr:cytochrome c [Acidobacteriota bacterium]
MKLVKIGLAGLAGVALVAGYFVVRPPKSAPPRQVRVAMTPETLARGKFLYNVVADCDGCHGERDLTKFGGPVHRSGAGFVFPPELGLPGKVVAPNITMDAETGLGAWTDGEKLRAIREGIGRDGRALFPMMPYEAFRRMSDADAEALVAYLNTLPAVKANLPRTQLDFPVSFLIKSAPEPVVGTVTAPQDLGEYL